MVFMNGLASAYALLRDRLKTVINEAVWPSPEAGFLDYLRVTTSNTIPQRPVVTDRLDETPMLAAAGYQYVNQRFQRDSQYDQEWARHFTRLAQRQAFPIDRESYFYRPLDLLGICIGAQSCPALGDSDRQWLKAILNDSAGRLPEREPARRHLDLAQHASPIRSLLGKSQPSLLAHRSAAARGQHRPGGQREGTCRRRAQDGPPAKQASRRHGKRHATHKPPPRSCALPVTDSHRRQRTDRPVRQTSNDPNHRRVRCTGSAWRATEIAFCGCATGRMDSVLRGERKQDGFSA